jgi:hypothetical protein
MQLSDVKTGDVLTPDGGFDCLKEGEPVKVATDDSGHYVPCTAGKHYLIGQLDEKGGLVGLQPKE